MPAEGDAPAEGGALADGDAPADSEAPAEEQVLAALGLEIDRLSSALSGLTETEWDLASGCPPWRVRDLLGHICVVLAWLPGMLAAPAPARAKVSSREYYRPDERFDPVTNARRITLATDHATELGSGLLNDFVSTAAQILTLCREQPAGRVVTTRHGDPMLLSDFLLTRVVEVAVHGIDLALALDRRPWTTSEAAALVTGLLLGPDAESILRRMHWSPMHFISMATGRVQPTDVESERIQDLGIRWLSLG